MPILSTIGAASSRAYGLSGFTLVPGNSGVLTSGTTYTLPLTSGTSVKIICIGGGGGGGGGSSRPISTTGAGGGGADIRSTTVQVTPGETITYSLGAGGAQGSPRDGPFSGGVSGSAGATSSVTVRGNTVLTAPAGGGGQVASTTSASIPQGGAAGSGGTGTQILTPNAGSNGNVTGGTGSGGASARGYSISTTIGATTPASYGATGAGGIGQSGSAGQTGTTYGGGGGGGGNNGTNNLAGMNPAVGGAGAVFIYWGY